MAVEMVYRFADYQTAISVLHKTDARVIIVRDFLFGIPFAPGIRFCKTGHIAPFVNERDTFHTGDFLLVAVGQQIGRHAQIPWTEKTRLPFRLKRFDDTGVCIDHLQ